MLRLKNVRPEFREISSVTVRLAALHCCNMPATPHDVAQAFVAAINAEDLSAMRALMAENHTFTDSLGNSFSGAEKMLSGWQQFWSAYPNYRIRITASLSEGHHVALFGEASGTWRVDGKVISQHWKTPAAWFAEIEDGRISRWTVYCDTGWARPPG
jgi:ketosteroid isomerase-like protein